MAQRKEHYDRDVGLGGVVAPMGLVSSTTAAIFDTAGHFARFVPSRNMTTTTISFHLVVRDATNPNVDVGIYYLGGAGTDYLLVGSSGATANKLNGAADSIQTVDLSTPASLTAGTVYWAAIASPSVVAQLSFTSYPGTTYPD